MSDPLDEAWTDLQDQWSDEAAHKRYIGLATSLGRLAEAGKHYREVRDDPAAPAERREIAKKRIDQLLAAALAAMAATKSPPAPKQHPKLVFVAAGICAAMILFALWAFLHQQ